jgi:hypothetical protein
MHPYDSYGLHAQLRLKPDMSCTHEVTISCEELVQGNNFAAPPFGALFDQRHK